MLRSIPPQPHFWWLIFGSNCAVGQSGKAHTRTTLVAFEFELIETFSWLLCSEYASGPSYLFVPRFHRLSLASPLAKAHTHPVYCVDVIGTQNAHNIITVSTDGKLCNWNLDMLKEPIESYDLQCGASKTVAATSIAFPHGDTGSFLAGSEEGLIYPFTRQGGKADFGEPFVGHSGPVTVRL